MALLKFLKGNYSSLNNAAIAEGQVLICSDTREMFVDIDASTRIKIGDFITVANMDALPSASTVPTSRLYYVEEGNILARSNGTEWIQINKQRTADEVKALIGLSNYELKTDAASKLTEAKGYTDAEVAKVQGEIDALETLVGALPEGTTAKDVVDYVNIKTSGIATDAALGELQNQLSGVQGEVNTIKGDYLKAADKTELQGKIDEKAAQSDLDAAEDRITALENANKEGGAVATSIANAQKAADDAQSTADDALANAATAQGEIDALEAVVGTVEEGKTVVGLIETAQTAADDAQASVDALAGKVGEVPAEKTIVQMISEAQTAATYDDAEVRELISDNAKAIETEKERAEGVEGGLRTDVDAIKGDYLKAADKEALQTQINTIMNNPDAEGAINSINEFTQYVTEHGTIAEGFRSDIDKNKEDIAANAKAIADQATSDAATYETKTDASSKLEEAKQFATDLNSDMNARVEALEAIDHEHENKALLDTYTQTEVDLADAVAKKHSHTFNETELNKIAEGDVAKWNAAEQNAKDHTDAEIAKLADGAVKTNTEAIATLKGEGDGSIKKMVDDAVAAEAEIARAAEKANADAIDAIEADYLKAVDKTELEGKITAEADRAKAAEKVNADAIALKANTADVYAKTETYTKTEIEALLTWGSF